MELKYIAIYEPLEHHHDGAIEAQRSSAKQGDRQE